MLPTPVPTPVPTTTPIPIREVIVNTQKLVGYQNVRVILKDGSVLTIPIGEDKVYVTRPNGGWGVLTLQRRTQEHKESHVKLQQSDTNREHNAKP